jgi:hypothetical protein
MSGDFVSMIQAPLFGVIPGQEWVMNVGQILNGYGVVGTWNVFYLEIIYRYLFSSWRDV